MRGHYFGRVYLVFTEGFGRFPRVAKAPGSKSESPAASGELTVVVWSVGTLGFRYHEPGTGTWLCVPVPGAGYRNTGGGTGTQYQVPVPQSRSSSPKPQQLKVN